MSTPANIYVFDAKRCVGAMHCQSDGYPAHLGKQIGSFLSSRRITNGIGDYATDCNGAENILPMLTYELMRLHMASMARFHRRLGNKPSTKVRAGYLYSLDTRKPFAYTTWNYHIIVRENLQLNIQVYDDEKKLMFNGNLVGFVSYCERAL